MILSRKQVYGPFPLIKIADKPVNFVLKSKCLGVTIDKDLSWHDHMNTLCSKLNTKVTMLKRMKSLNSHTLESFYFSTIIPSVTYGISVWGNCSKVMMKKLNDIHVRAAKIIYGFGDNYDESILDKVKWKNMSYFYKRSILVLMYKVFNNNIPSRFGKRFELKNTRSLRKNNNFVIKRCASESSRYCFTYRGCVLWNNLPDDIKEAGSLDDFKVLLKKNSHLIDNFSFNHGASTRTYVKNDFIYF